MVLTAQENDRSKIAVVGAGNVGLTLAVLLSRQHEVCVVDIVPDKVAMINRQQSPIEDSEIKEYLSGGKLDLTATTDLGSACRGADYVIIAVPTDFDSETGRFNTEGIEQCLRQARTADGSAMVVIKSTVPIGYTAALRKRTGDQRILFSPEFLQEGRALHDNLYPSRIVVGTDMKDEEQVRDAWRFADLLRKAAVKTDVDALVMDLAEAEAVKLFSNTYLAMRVCFFNELDSLAERDGLDAGNIVKGVCLDPRIGDHYNNPSFGYGGYCLPKDVRQLAADYRDTPQRLIGSVDESNRIRKEHAVKQIIKCVKDLDEPVVGVYRLGMKAGSNSFRESAVLDIISQLRARGMKLLVYEPALGNTDDHLGYQVENDLTRFCDASDVIVANRYDACLEHVKNKVYTRDLLGSD